MNKTNKRDAYLFNTLGCLQINGTSFQTKCIPEKHIEKNHNPFNSPKMPTSRMWNYGIKYNRKYVLFFIKFFIVLQLQGSLMNLCHCIHIPMLFWTCPHVKLPMPFCSTRLHQSNFFSLHLQIQLVACTLVLLFIFSDIHILVIAFTFELIEALWHSYFYQLTIVKISYPLMIRGQIQPIFLVLLMNFMYNKYHYISS